MTHPTLALIEKRVSANLFEASHVLPDGEIEDLVRLATRAPTAYHLQNWHFIAVRSPDAKARLSDLADCLKKKKKPATLEGHADDRGTEEYNMQLSNRRAESVKSYLTALGVNERQLDTVGFGENRPAMSGASEDVWSANRRVEIKQ